MSGDWSWHTKTPLIDIYLDFGEVQEIFYHIPLCLIIKLD